MPLSYLVYIAGKWLSFEVVCWFINLPHPARLGLEFLPFGFYPIYKTPGQDFIEPDTVCTEFKQRLIAVPIQIKSLQYVLKLSYK